MLHKLALLFKSVDEILKCDPFKMLTIVQIEWVGIIAK